MNFSQSSSNNLGRDIANFSIPISENIVPDSVRGKVAKKGGKNDQAVVESKPQMSEAVNHLLERRRQVGGWIDLGVLTLDEVVWHCH